MENKAIKTLYILLSLFILISQRPLYSSVSGYMSHPARYAFCEDILINLTWDKNFSGMKTEYESFETEAYIPRFFSTGFALPHGIFGIYAYYYDEYDYLGQNYQYSSSDYFRDGIRQKGYTIAVMHAWKKSDMGYGLKFRHSFSEYNKKIDELTIDEYSGDMTIKDYSDPYSWFSEELVFEFGRKGSLFDTFNSLLFGVQYFQSKEDLFSYTYKDNAPEVTRFSNENLYHYNIVGISHPLNQYKLFATWNYDWNTAIALYLSIALSGMGAYSPLNSITHQTNFYLQSVTPKTNKYYDEKYYYEDKGDIYNLNYYPTLYIGTAFISAGFGFNDLYTFENFDETLDWQFNAEKGIIDYEVSRIINRKTFSYYLNLKKHGRNQYYYLNLNYKTYRTRYNEKAG